MKPAAVDDRTSTAIKAIMSNYDSFVILQRRYWQHTALSIGFYAGRIKIARFADGAQLPIGAPQTAAKTLL